MATIKEIAATAAADIEASGGTTINRHGQSPRQGYAVSLSGHEWRCSAVTEPHLLPRLLETYIVAKRTLLLSPGRYLGAWVDGTTLYLDVSEVVEHEWHARALAQERGQLAIFSFADRQVIEVES